MANDTSAAREANARLAAAREDKLAEQVEALIADPQIDPELKRKLHYCQAQLDYRREGTDLPLMTQRRKELLREATRRP